MGGLPGSAKGRSKGYPNQEGCIGAVANVRLAVFHARNTRTVFRDAQATLPSASQIVPQLTPYWTREHRLRHRASIIQKCLAKSTTGCTKLGRTENAPALA